MDLILCWLVVIDILLRLIIFFLDSRKPEPLTALYYDFTRIDIEELKEIINESNDEQRKQRFKERLLERDYYNRKYKKDGHKNG